MPGGMERMWDPRNIGQGLVDYLTKPVGPPEPAEPTLRAQPSGLAATREELARRANQLGALIRRGVTGAAETIPALAGLARGLYEAYPPSNLFTAERFAEGMEKGVESIPYGREIMEAAEAARIESDRMMTGPSGKGGIATVAGALADYQTPGVEDAALAGVPALFRITKKLEEVPKFSRRTPWKPREVRKSRVTLEKEAKIRGALDERLPLAKEQIRSAIHEGKMWYNLTPLYNKLAQQYGAKRARQMVEGFAARMGPASSGSDMPATVRRALFAQHAAARGVDIESMHPRYSAPPFRPQGHERYFRAMQPGFKRIQEAELTGGDPLDVLLTTKSGLKWRPFAGALNGDYGNVPVDVHEMRFWFGDHAETGPKMLPKNKEAPKEPQRRALQALYDDLSKELNLTPAQTMAARWVGGAGMTGVSDPRPAIMILNDEIGKIAAEIGQTPADILQGVFEGKYNIPLGEFELRPGLTTPAKTVGLGNFVRARNAAREELLRRGDGKAAFLGTETGDELKVGPQKMYFLSDGGKVGGYVTPDGYIGNLWNISDVEGAGSRLMDHLIAVAGPNAHLDHFDGRLSEIYEKLGFVETSRTPWNPEYAPPDWDYEKFDHPDYIERRWGGPQGDPVSKGAEAQAAEEVIGTGPLYDRGEALVQPPGGLNF